MKKIFAAIICLLSVICTRSNAQTQKIIDNDSLLHVFLRQDKFSIDTGAHAVILQDNATGNFRVKTIHNYYWYELFEYTIERCIRINSQQALELADVSIPSSKDFKVKNMDFESINLVNGQIVRQKLRKPDILKEKVSKQTKMHKFSFPNVKPGTIIYYTYTYQLELGKPATSTYFPLTWKFQNEYPTLESRFTVTIPGEIDFIAIPKNIRFDTVHSKAALARGDRVQYIDSVVEHGVLKSITATWVRRNIDGLNDIEFLLNPESKKEKVTVNVVPYFEGISSITSQIPRSWSAANSEYFYTHKFLGRSIFRPSDTLSIALNEITSGNTDNLAMAKAIYKFVRDSIESTGYSEYDRIWASWLPRAVLRRKKGTIADKNILLCALLNKAGLKSYPILICTADEDKIEEHYFEPDALNYVVSLLIINDQYYLLDAASKYLPFGILRPKCYNGFSWIVSEKGAGVTLSPDSLMEKSTCSVSIQPGKRPGAYHMLMEQKPGNVTAPALRAMLELDSSGLKKEFEKKINKLNYNVKLNKCTIHNAGNADTSLIITYDLDLQLDTASNISYLNPFFHKLFETNPFIAAERKYPVEFGSPFQHLFILKFQLEKGYRFEDYENPVSLRFQDGSISYKHTAFYNGDDNILNLSCLLSSKTGIVAPEYYNELRSFYDRIITEQNKKLIIKKADL